MIAFIPTWFSLGCRPVSGFVFVFLLGGIEHTILSVLLTRRLLFCAWPGFGPPDFPIAFGRALFAVVSVGVLLSPAESNSVCATMVMGRARAVTGNGQ